MRWKIDGVKEMLRHENDKIAMARVRLAELRE